MLINEFRLKNLQTPIIKPNSTQPEVKKSTNTNQSDFAKTFKKELEKNQKAVEFSKHAMDRINERSIDLNTENKLERLNKALEIAEEKGANETLVLIDQTAFIVNVKNNKVITTMDQNDMVGKIFTNIDSTVII